MHKRQITPKSTRGDHSLTQTDPELTHQLGDFVRELVTILGSLHSGFARSHLFSLNPSPTLTRLPKRTDLRNGAVKDVTRILKSECGVIMQPETASSMSWWTAIGLELTKSLLQNFLHLRGNRHAKLLLRFTGKVQPIYSVG
jgi:hypothetical protein